MNVYIDGENCRKGLTRVLVENGTIANSREMTTYKMRGLLADVLVISSPDDLVINYYASEIRLPNGYTPSPDVMSHVQVIRNYSRDWVNNL